jgi:hypothetical protein
VQAAALSPFYAIHTQRPGPSKKMFTRERTIIKRIHVIGEPAADVAQHKDMQAKPDIQQVHVRPYEIIIKATYG